MARATRIDWVLAYTYFVLCLGSYAAYRGAPTATLLAVGIALALPHIRNSSSKLEAVVHVLVSLLFAGAAHGFGRAIDVLLRT